MGIAGAGNSGTVLAALFAPMLAIAFGWHNVFGLACLPLMLTLLVFAACARDAPVTVQRKQLSDYGRVLVGNRDSWWFMLFYAITFGGFAGFASALPGYFHDQFGFDSKIAGWATAACVLAGSVMRPIGGVIADRIGGTRTLLAVYFAVAALVATAGFGFGGSVATVAPVRAHAAVPRRRQRRGVPVGAAAFRQRHRPDDRIDRHGRRHRRLHARGRHGRGEAAHRQLRDQPVAVRRHRAGGVGACCPASSTSGATSGRRQRRARVRIPPTGASR